VLLLKLLQQLVKALNSEGTPRQVAAGITLGACLGLTPIGNLHNVAVFLLALVLNVSLAGFALGWTAFVPLGFAFDPLFDAVGRWLLSAPSLTPLWTKLTNLPVVPYTHFDNTVVLGSFVCWVVAFAPILLLTRWLVATYRARVYERLKKLKVFQVIGASKLYQAYRLFRPE
jgi:uncharacterized protein (TIGR03546 family)